MRLFHGSIIDHPASFVIAEGGVRFEPFNAFHAVVRPRDILGADPSDVQFTLEDDEFFQVRAEIDPVEGRLGSRPGGNFLNYSDALRAARGQGVQGGTANVVIMMPQERDVTVVDEDHDTVIIGTEKTWEMVDLSFRLRFPNRTDVVYFQR